MDHDWSYVKWIVIGLILMDHDWSYVLWIMIGLILNGSWLVWY